jgi:Stress responsive A/B Barrel Domain
MIAHVVLFQPRAGLSDADRAAFAASFEHALTRIPRVRRAYVGERVNLGRFYDQHNARDFSHLAIIEFDSEADLRAYLDHPAHQELGERFYSAAEAALVFDFALTEGQRISDLLRARE